MILDITNAEEPKVDQVFNAGGHICDARSVQLGVTYNSLFAYIADGKNGMRIVQLQSPETPGYEGFSTRRRRGSSRRTARRTGRSSTWLVGSTATARWTRTATRLACSSASAPVR